MCRTASTVAAGMSERSGQGNAASSAASPVEDSPAAWVSEASRTPCLRSVSSTLQVRGSPAEGASTDQGRAPYAVCTCHSDSGASRYAYCTGRPLR
ncbi:hypothetical protein MYXA107069_36760 [Myxococcus xanthus]